ncbi:three-Cys-motif partner protein TcmP [Methylocystis hirsuta]|uniref:Three-Cys-motif partner protein TcmP n=1 Tax=Methylocystis hirsuta TaxID=369798 RepID=A0A3M9XJU1_9HYPH|nr:three-Cys-motif partner protein TcmP [Methylocystis hirsuta]RNJ48523.1 three-Cys-motif partner protein TcmP [Methylocystis hirsuta]
MKAAKFFDERTDQSVVKARIVEKYFYAWANVVMPTAQRSGGRIAYIDLYAGPGRYKDGAASTPLLVLQHAINDPKLASMLVALLNDSDSNKTSTLKAEIDSLPGIGNLKHKPVLSCGEIDDDAEKYFNDAKLVPSFSFIDPFGYKGLSLKIIRGVIKDWGCDCVFFFNYNRINAGIGNQAVTGHMDALFGKERADALRMRLPRLSPELREALILEELAAEIKALGGTYVLPFTFRNSSGTRTSHKLVFVSKSFKGYAIMKDIMAKESSTEDQGVPSLTYSPADWSMPLLFSLQRPLDQLRASLLTDFAGQEVSVADIYERHSVDTPYVIKNYKETLKQLEAEGKVVVRSLQGIRRKGTFADHLLVGFPPSSIHGK